jgi:DNA-binding transcriptional ArsR family regulator
VPRSARATLGCVASIVPSPRFALAELGELLSDPSRVAMLLALMDGSTRPAGELAQMAGVAPSTATAHLLRLVEGGMLTVAPSGRRRFFRIASDEVADCIERMALVSRGPAGVRPRASLASRSPIAEARTCYRHLAGRLGVRLFAALEDARSFELHDGAVRLSSEGERRLHDAGLGVVDRWPAGKVCLDWSERRSHLGGELGRALTDALFARRWIARQQDSRGVRVTVEGARAFAASFGIAV